MKKQALFLALVICCIAASAQKQSYKVTVVAFYNLENFYDTIDDFNVQDEEFTPKGEKNYNSSIYKDKVTKLATVVSQIGDEYPTNHGPSLLGVAEIENDNVLRDLAAHDLLKHRNYKFVHYNSRDVRGVDVALFYNPQDFVPEDSRALFVQLPGGSKDAYYTRDVLWVKGKLNGETVHIYVNHWPSRRGGEERSAPARAAAALVSKNHLDSIQAKDGPVKSIIMGDLNDDPVSPSLTYVLKAKELREDVKPGGLYNPWVDFYKRGLGTLAYQDAWGLFDQIVIGQSWLDKAQNGFFFYQAKVFNRQYLVENQGRYKGYPMRTWDGNTYRGGYSDHFPTYIVLAKKDNAVATKN